MRIFGEPPRPGAVQDGGDISELPESPAPVTTGSGSELRRGRRRRPTFFLGGGLLHEFHFICITKSGGLKKPFRGNRGGWGQVQGRLLITCLGELGGGGCKPRRAGRTTNFECQVFMTGTRDIPNYIVWKFYLYSSIFW